MICDLTHIRDAAFDGKEHEVDTKKPESAVNVSPSSSAQSGKQDDKTNKKAKRKRSVESFTGNKDLSIEFEDHSDNSSSDVNVVGSIVPTAGQNSSNSTNPFSVAGIPSDSLGIRTRSSTLDFITSSDSVAGIVSRCSSPILRELSGFSVDKTGNIEEKILVPKPPKNYARCAKCGHPVNGPYCQGCALLREKLEEDLVTYLKYFHESSESSDDSTNVVNAPREPFDVKQDHGVKSSQNPPLIDKCCCECGNALDGIFCQQCICKSCGKGLKIYQGPDPIRHTQEEGIDYKEVFASVPRIKAIRSMIGSLMHLTLSRPDIMFTSTDFTRLQALVDRKKVVVTEAAIRYVLCLDDADGVDCLPNDEIFAELARMGYEKPSTKLTFYKAFFLSQVGKGFSGVETPLFEGMLVVGEIVEQGDAEEQVQDNVDDAAQGDDTAVSGDDVQDQSIPLPTPPTPPSQQPQDLPSTSQEALDACSALTTRVEHLEHDKVAQAPEFIKLKKRVKKLEWANKVKVLKLRRLKKGRMIADLDRDTGVALMDDERTEKKAKNAQVASDEQVKESESVTAASATVAAVPAATITAAPYIFKLLVSKKGAGSPRSRTIGENRASWSDKLDDALWAFRTAYKTPIGCTPYKLVYGKACHLSIEVEHKAYWALKQANFDLTVADDHRKIQLNELNEIRDHAYDNSLIYKEKTKKIHDSKIKNRVFNIGDRVLLFNSRLKIFSSKLKTRWSGPFTIAKVFPYGTVELSQVNGPNFKVNGHRVKHYFGGDVPQLVVPDLQTFPSDQ
nr:reverse transcriptase domain-containing protein [Tanacetum cinerariifolium]